MVSLILRRCHYLIFIKMALMVLMVLLVAMQTVCPDTVFLAPEVMAQTAILHLVQAVLAVLIHQVANHIHTEITREQRELVLVVEVVADRGMAA